MNTICIVTCGKRKVWDDGQKNGPSKARDVYIGSFSRKCQEYAKKFYPNNWIILSAKYGFLEPDDIVPGPYDVCFNDKNAVTISVEKLKKQIKEKNLDKYDKILILGGKYYTEMIKNVFVENEVINPLDGCKGMGYMMAKLNNELRNR